MTVEELKVLITAEMSGVKKEVDKVRKQMDVLNKTVDASAKKVDKSTKRISASFSAMGKTIKRIVSVAALLSLGKQAIELASDLEEVQNVVDTAFGSMANEANKFAQNALESFGITETMAKRMSSTFMVMSNSLGVAKKQGKEMAFTLTGLAGDMSSFYNVSQDIAETALKSIFTGETEALKKFGIVMTDTNLEAFAAGMGKVYKNMSQAEKVTLRYQYVLKNTGQAQGDFAKTSKSWANQIRILKGQIQELLAIIGSGLKNVLTPVVIKLNDLLAVAIKAAKIFADVFGWDNSSTGSQIKDIVEDLENATEEANALKKATMGFDELNILDGEKKTADNSGGNSGDDDGTLPDIATKEEEPGWAKNLRSTLETIKKLADNIGNIFSNDDLTFTEKFKKAWEQIKTELELDTWLEGLKTKFDELSTNASTLSESLGTINTDLGGIGGSATKLLDIMKNLFILFATYKTVIPVIGLLKDKFVELYDKNKKIVKFIATESDVFQETIDTIKMTFPEFFSAISSPFTSVLDLFSKLGSVISGLSAPVLIVVAAIALLAAGFVHAYQTSEEFAKMVNGAIETVKGGFQSFYDNILVPIGNKIGEVFGKISDAIKEYVAPAFDKLKIYFGDLLTLISHLWELISPVVLGLYEGIVLIVGILLTSLMPAFDALMNTIGAIGVFVAQAFGSVVDILSGIIDFITSIFAKEWKKAWESLGDVASGIIDIILAAIRGVLSVFTGIVDGIISGVIKAVNFIIDALNSIKFDAPKWLNDLGVNDFNGFGLKRIEMPKLANGGVITSPTMAMMGEYAGAKTNPEIVAPESLLRNIFEESQTNVINAVYSMGNMISKAIKDKDMNTYLDGMELSRGLYNHTNLIQQQKGLSLIK